MGKRPRNRPLRVHVTRLNHAHNNLGTALARLGEPATGTTCLQEEECLTVKPPTPEAMGSL
jgi:hypothetical protein